MAARKQGKNNFAVTCNLLSQYIKEKGRIADLGLGMAPRPQDATKGESLRVSAAHHHEPVAGSGRLERKGRAGRSRFHGAVFPACRLRPLPRGGAGRCQVRNLHPILDSRRSMIVFVVCHFIACSTSIRCSRAKRKIEGVRISSNGCLYCREHERAPLTIFYGGKVLVFDNFPLEKAKDLFQLASRGNPTARNFGNLPRTAQPTTLSCSESLHLVVKISMIPAFAKPQVSDDVVWLNCRSSYS
ncbi:hypothetical protein BHE74_00032600 [Ensete ventricosum]|nr:hypothetical protein BHE74_00032600 [Ensete ventricosum]